GDPEVTLLAGQTALWLGLGLAGGFLFVLTLLPLLAVILAVFDGGAGDIADVQRFIALTEEARSFVPPGLPLFDAEKAAATTAALVRFQAKKDEARRALWASRDGRPAIASTKSAGKAVSSESKLAVADLAIRKRAWLGRETPPRASQIRQSNSNAFTTSAAAHVLCREVCDV